MLIPGEVQPGGSRPPEGEITRAEVNRSASRSDGNGQLQRRLVGLVSDRP
jgi:hypothetical protein